MKTEKLIEKLGLCPHPEGGYFKETYRAKETTSAANLPDRYNCNHNHSTAIYYLLTKNDFSALHILESDEIFHFYDGHPLEMLQINKKGESKIIELGPQIENGQIPQVLVPRGVWQGLRLKEGGQFALLGCTVSPGFDFADFKMGKRSELLKQFPHLKKEIVLFTKTEKLNDLQRRI